LIKGNVVVDRMKDYYLSYGKRLKERMVDVFGTLVNATQYDDKNAVA
jgi:F0F1-type ATP synthase beta subunit